MTYNAESFELVSEMNHVRARIAQYLGDNSGPGGMTTALRELTDNAQDEFLNGHGNKIIINFYPDGSSEVIDNGRGVPVDINKKTGDNGVVIAFGHARAGGKFNTENSGYKSGSGGLHGVGASAAQAASERFDVTVYKNGKKYRQSFSKGLPGTFSKENDPHSRFTPRKEVGPLKEEKDDRPKKDREESPTGTTIRMWPDYDLFLAGAKYDVPSFIEKMKFSAYLLPGLTYIINDYRKEGEPKHYNFCFDGGVQEMVRDIQKDGEYLKDPLFFESSTSFSEKAPCFVNDEMVIQEVERPFKMEVAFTYGTGYDTNVKSFANIIYTKHGGKHEDGFYNAMRRVIINKIKNTKGMLRAKEDAPILEDVKEGLTAVLSVKFPEPQFPGQDKSELGTKIVSELVSRELGNELEKFLDNKKNAAITKKICSKVVNASRARTAQQNKRELVRKKTALESNNSAPSKLLDCTYPFTEQSELQICEGNSAFSTIQEARTADYTAALPIRGKVINARKSSEKAILDNAECSSIIQAIGAGFKKDFDIDKMRYQNICIAADADLDGNHIRTLLITFFHEYMRPVIEEGRLYTVVLPLYSVKHKVRGGEIKQEFILTEADKDRRLKELEKTGTVLHVGRLKGLGEMNAEDYFEAALNPEERVLRRITVDDAIRAEEIIEITMGKSAEKRKEWINEYSLSHAIEGNDL